MRAWMGWAIGMALLAGAVSVADNQTGAVSGTVHIDFVPPPRMEGEPGYGGPAQPAPKDQATRKKEEQANVVVYLADDHPNDGMFAGRHYVASATAPHARMNQKDKTFLPHVLAVEQGTIVEFPNEDPFFHNVFSYSPGNSFDLKKYTRDDPPKLHECKTPGVIDIFCDIHRTMRAYVVVVEHPFFTVPDSEGRFELKDLPPGKWTLVAWHPLLEVQPKVPMEIQAGARATVDLHLVK